MSEHEKPKRKKAGEPVTCPGKLARFDEPQAAEAAPIPPKKPPVPEV